MNSPSALTAEFLKNFGICRQEGGIENASELEGRTRRVHKRSNHVENTGAAPSREFLPDGNDATKSGMKSGGKEKTTASSIQSLSSFIRGKLYFDSEGFKDISSSGLGADPTVSMLHDTRTCASGDKHDSG